MYDWFFYIYTVHLPTHFVLVLAIRESKNSIGSKGHFFELLIPQKESGRGKNSYSCRDLLLFTLQSLNFEI